MNSFYLISLPGQGRPTGEYCPHQVRVLFVICRSFGNLVFIAVSPFTSLFLLPFSPLWAAAGCSNVFPWGGEQRGIAPLCSPERQKGNQSQNRTPDNNAQGRSRRQPHQPPHPSPGGGGEGHPGREHCSSAPGVSPGGGGFGANVHSCTVCFHNPPLQLQEGKAGGNHRCACSLPPGGLVPIPA